MSNEEREQEIMFSRSTMGGKKTSKVEARVSDDLKDRLSKIWREAGYTSESEFVEKILSHIVYGQKAVEERQRAMAAPILNPFKE